MKIRTGLVTVFAVMLLSVNAFASSWGTFDVSTHFLGWNDPIYNWQDTDDGPVDVGFWGWEKDSVDSYIVTNGFYEGEGGAATSGMYFGGGDFPSGASQFSFLYGTDFGGFSGYLDITLTDRLGGNVEDPAGYFHVQSGSSVTGFSDDIGISSTVRVFLELSMFEVDNLHFYFNTSEDLVAVTALTFVTQQGTMSMDAFGYNPVATPIPGAAWLLGSGLVGLVGLRRRFKA